MGNRGVKKSLRNKKNKGKLDFMAEVEESQRGKSFLLHTHTHTLHNAILKLASFRLQCPDMRENEKEAMKERPFKKGGLTWKWGGEEEEGVGISTCCGSVVATGQLVACPKSINPTEWPSFFCFFPPPLHPTPLFPLREFDQKVSHGVDICTSSM